MKDKLTLLRLCCLVVGVCGVLFAVLYAVQQNFIGAGIILLLTAAIFFPSRLFATQENTRFFCYYTVVCVNLLIFSAQIASMNFTVATPFFICAGVLFALFFDTKLLKFGFVVSFIAYFFDYLAISLLSGGLVFPIFTVVECSIAAAVCFFLVLQAIKHGNRYLEEAISERRQGETLVQELNEQRAEQHTVMEKQERLLEKMEEISVHVSADAQQLAHQSDTLATGSSTQAQSIQNVTSAVSQMRAHIEDTARQAQDVREESQAMSQQINVGAAQMKDMLQAVDRIRESSLSIEKIIKTIEDIAFQTNILALNASVEAAHAGAAGKGFAVVAEEVRNLASRSSEAAKSTTVLIDECLNAIEHGNTVADETAQALEGIRARAETVTQKAFDISDRTNDQTTKMNHINDEISQISNLIQTMAASAQESAATSRTLSEQAVLLAQLSEK